MRKNLAKNLPQLSDADRQKLFGSITDAITYPRGDPIREGVITAYDATMKVMIIAATALSVVPILISLTMPNWYLGDSQNSVDDADLTGERVPRSDGEEQELRDA